MRLFATVGARLDVPLSFPRVIRGSSAFACEWEQELPGFLFASTDSTNLMIPIGDTLKLLYHHEKSILVRGLVRSSSCNFPPTLEFSLIAKSNLFVRCPVLVLLDNLCNFDLSGRNEMMCSVIRTFD